VFGTRADAFIDFTFAVTLIAPLVVWLSMRAARARSHELHRRVQIGFLVVAIIAVVVLEVRIRMSGGSGSLLSQSAPGRTTLARVALGVHITVAVLTYALWTWLAVASSRRFNSELPGPFSRRHRRLGTLVFAGLVISALSASVMYTLAFVL
jgi:putative membrane protein